MSETQAKLMNIKSSSTRITTNWSMPRYKCHKEVWALKIVATKSVNTDKMRYFLVPARSESYGDIEVSRDWMLKHNPTPGGYYVVYNDGYTSFSPAEAFESGYELIDN